MKMQVPRIRLSRLSTPLKCSPFRMSVAFELLLDTGIFAARNE
jgi:hypothetical protein